jgi:hypothetical protein
MGFWAIKVRGRTGKKVPPVLSCSRVGLGFTFGDSSLFSVYSVYSVVHLYPDLWSPDASRQSRDGILLSWEFKIKIIRVRELRLETEGDFQDRTFAGLHFMFEADNAHARVRRVEISRRRVRRP